MIESTDICEDCWHDVGCATPATHETRDGVKLCEKCWGGVVEGSGRGELDLTIDETLTEREKRYGSFSEHARVTQNIKRAMQDSPNWAALPDDTKECFEMIAHKMGRALNGDPEYADNIHDIIGYARLVEQRMEGK